MSDPSFRAHGFRLQQLCEFLDISRQAYYRRKKQTEKKLLEQELIIQKVKELRGFMPRLGTRKLYYKIREEGIPVKIGRDGLFALLKEHNLLIRPKRQYVRTTNSNHFFWVYSNQIKQLVIDHPGQVIVSDITYLKTVEGFCYLFLITDVYSRKILGHYLSKTLEAGDAAVALNKALFQITNPEGMIHHSDRGIQYCSKEYTALLKRNGVKISMGEAGNPYENAIAERVNGILKYEFMLNTTFNSFRDARLAVDEAVNIYNSMRPHLSLNFLTPNQIYAA